MRKKIPLIFLIFVSLLQLFSVSVYAVPKVSNFEYNESHSFSEQYNTPPEGAGKADIGNKLDYVFGKATGNTHNIQRSQSMMNELKRIGVHDTSANRALLQSHLDDVVSNSKNIIGTELRSYTVNGQTFEYTATIRESFFMGPGGGVKFESVWDGNRLLTVIIKGGN